MWDFFKKAAFTFDAEIAHDAFTFALQHAPKPFLRSLACPAASSVKKVKIAEITFGGRVGLAAGFDKNAKLLSALPSLGFNFAEIGTVTPKPQPGNPKPRLFRLPEEKALFNCFGFNSDGAAAVAKRLEQGRKTLPKDFILGINIGKNKNTPLEDAHLDYAVAAKTVAPYADYLTINISSPNTPGLRSLQNKDSLAKIFSAVENSLSTSMKRPPIFLKLAPELSESDWESFLLPFSEENPQLLAGWVITNTIAHHYRNLLGGLSGLPLGIVSLARLKWLRSRTALPIMSVGGIMTPQDALERIQQGADLLQIYTGWIYNGPRFPGQICRLVNV